MAAVRLGRSVPLVAPRRRKAAAMTATPSLQCPPSTRLGARVEVFYEGSWVSATVLSGNLPTSAAIRVRIDGAPAGTGYRSIARCFVRAPSAACREKSSSKKGDVAAAAAADDGNASTLPSAVTAGTAKAVATAANGHASTLPRVVQPLSPAIRAPTGVGKKLSCGRAPVPEADNALPLRKRPLEPTETAGSQKRAKPGARIGSHACCTEEVKPLHPNCTRNASCRSSAGIGKKRSKNGDVAAAAADDGNASTPSSAVTAGTAKAVAAAANGHASILRRVVQPLSPAINAPTGVGKKRSCGRAPAPEPANATPPRKRPLEPMEAVSSQKKTKPGPGVGISRAALQRWFEEVKPHDPNARLPRRSPMQRCCCRLYLSDDVGCVCC